MGQRLNVFEQLTDDIRTYIADNIDSESLENNDVAINQQFISEIDDSEQLTDTKLLKHEIPVDIRLINEDGQFLGLGAVSLNGRLQPKKLIQR
jgi:tRNA pseudouridine55 synthase